MEKSKLLSEIRNYRYENPNVDQLKNGYLNDYIKFRHPYYNNEPREPENWYVIEMTKKIIEFAEKWQQIIIENSCPSDFQIWLYEPYFNNSQIVAARIDEIGEERDNFFHKPKIENEFPYEYFGTNSDLNIEWVHRHEVQIVYDFDNPTNEEISELLRTGYIFKKVYFESFEREVELYQKVIGNVWVGRFK